MKRVVIGVLSLVALCSVACSRIADTTTTTGSTSSVTSGTASIKVIELRKSDKPIKILAVIQNVGNADADKLIITVKPRKGTSVLESHVITTNISLAADEDYWVDLELTSLTSHTDYDDIVFDFSWSESKSGAISLESLVK